MHKCADKVGITDEHPMNKPVNSTVDRNGEITNFTFSTSFYTFIHSSFTFHGREKTIEMSRGTQLYTY